MNTAKIAIISLAVFVIVTIGVTQLLQEMVFFSLFIGIPAGIASFLLTFIYLYTKKSNDKS